MCDSCLWIFGFLTPYFFRFSPQPKKKHPSHPFPPIPEVSARSPSPPSPVASPRCLCPAHWAQPPAEGRNETSRIFPGEKKCHKLIARWWLRHPSQKIWVKMGIFPKYGLFLDPKYYSNLYTFWYRQAISTLRYQEYMALFFKVATCLIESCSCFFFVKTIAQLPSKLVRFSGQIGIWGWGT